MTRLTLKPAAAGGAPGGAALDASGLIPETIAGLGEAAIARLRLEAAGATARVGDFFTIEGSGGDEVVLEGELGRWARVGAGMSRGRLTVRGSVGVRAGARMTGGVLTIEGQAGDYAGEGMTDGTLHVRGDAGDHLAAPLPGLSSGLNGGSVIVEGRAGRMAGRGMRRGVVAIGGDAGDGAATMMRAGTLVVLGRLGAGAGALMRRGTLVALGSAEPPCVFLDAGVLRHPFLNLYYDALESAGLAIPPAARRGRYRAYVGDVTEGGRGEILALQEAVP